MLYMQKQTTNLSIFKGDLPDQRHTLVLGPCIGQVKVGEWAEVDHVRDALTHRFVDHIVPTEALRLRDSARGKSGAEKFNIKNLNRIGRLRQWLIYEIHLDLKMVL